MKDKLPKSIKFKECGIINLDDSKNAGTHWCAYVKSHKNVLYYDSFGDLPPPRSLVSYFGSCSIYYNFNKQQSFGTANCGKLCLQFLDTFKID